MIEVWYGDEQEFGQSGNPQRWVNILGRVHDNSGIHSLSYRLGNGDRIPVQTGPSAFRLRNEGDFNIELDGASLESGKNKLTIYTINMLGVEEHKEVGILYNPYGTCALPMLMDFSSDTPAPAVMEGMRIVDGRWKRDKSGLRIVEPGYDRLVAFGDVAWKDYEVTTRLTLHGFDERPASRVWPSLAPAIGIGLRWKGHFDWHDIMPRRGYYPLGSLVLHSFKNDWFQMECDEFHKKEYLEKRMATGLEYTMRARVQTMDDGLPLYSSKMWSAGELEPPGWQLTMHGTKRDLDEGGLFLLAHHVDVSFKELRVSAL